MVIEFSTQCVSRVTGRYTLNSETKRIAWWPASLFQLSWRMNPVQTALTHPTFGLTRRPRGVNKTRAWRTSTYECVESRYSPAKTRVPFLVCDRRNWSILLTLPRQFTVLKIRYVPQFYLRDLVCSAYPSFLFNMFLESVNSGSLFPFSFKRLLIGMGLFFSNSCWRSKVQKVFWKYRKDFEAGFLHDLHIFPDSRPCMMRQNDGFKDTF